MTGTLNQTEKKLDECRCDKDLYETVHNMLLVLLGKDTEELEEDFIHTGVMSFVGDITNQIIKALWSRYRMRVGHPAVTTEEDGNQYYDVFGDEAEGRIYKIGDIVTTSRNALIHGEGMVISRFDGKCDCDGECAFGGECEDLNEDFYVVDFGTEGTCSVYKGHIEQKKATCLCKPK